jgi:hypothetical protein
LAFINCGVLLCLWKNFSLIYFIAL